ncbi:hypothetical protein QT979_02865 [Microcoleus sp. w2-18bC1]|uniref:hypothetical protein n=1 Tax=unclassified Microcoleus TaxID=2642155 RepID=UPI002FD4B03C
MVIASLRPLRQIATESESAIEQLTVKQVVVWFVKDGKIRTREPRRLFWTCELKVDRPHWQIIRRTRLLGAVSGDRKKVLTKGLTD